MPSPALSAGTVTILFTNIEDSVRLLQRLGDYRYAQGTRVLHPTTEVGASVPWTSENSKKVNRDAQKSNKATRS